MPAVAIQLLDRLGALGGSPSLTTLSQSPLLAMTGMYFVEPARSSAFRNP
jgi:hypothetical protein